MSLWEVSTISVNTVSPDHQNISLFANGRHQIPVNVFISAKEKGSTKRYRLSPEELKSVQLIDYVTNEELTGDWTYSTTRNEFSHSVSSMPVADSAQSPETAQNAAFDNKRDTIQFWISTTEIANKEIAASITSPEGIKSGTNDSHNYSSVIVTIKAPITYTTEDIVLEKHVEEHGSYLLDWMNFFGVWEKAWPGYWQTNHYLSLRNKVPVCKSENVGLDTHANPRLNNAFGYWHSDGFNLRIYYIWECGPETTKKVGVNYDGSIWKDGLHVGRIAHAEKDIQVNQRPGMLCMTVLYYASEDRIWWRGWYTDPCGFVIYDIYGNRGEFSLSFALDRIVVKS